MASSSSSLASHPLKYDVFLSFRGEDTRRGFISHLCAALRQKALQTFFDDDDLKRGEEIAQSLPRAIQYSTVAILVFSKDYASSRWCLDELAEIMECHRSHGQIVIPVFYEVNPSHLRKQSDDVAAAFVKHEQNPMNAHKIPRWKDALTKAADLSGFDSKNFGNDDLLINKIVEDILEKLNQSVSRDDFEHLVGMGLVGMDSRIKEIKKVFTINPFKARILGIWGMGGIGKTTTATVIYQMMSYQFEGCCFLDNVGQRADNKLYNKLWEELILKIFGEKASERYTLDASLHPFLKERLGRKKVLLVLEDVNNPDQIEFLIGDPCWFGSGSMILITSRNKQVFEGRADFIYKVELLNYDEALQLFSKRAFRQNYPRDDFALMSKSFVQYTQGNPLALKVLGSHLNGKNHEEWKSALSLLSEVQIDGIQQVLRISYNGLSIEERGIFLDIACFFEQGHIYVKADILRKIYKSSGFDITLSVLVDKCLVTSKDLLGMHDLIQEMGKAVVLQKDEHSYRHPYQRSRLWDPKDIYEVFAGNKEAEAVQTITLDLSKIREMNLNPEVFMKMPNLRFFNFYGKSNLHFSKGLHCLPNTLRYLRWENYPLESLPPNSLVVLELPNSNMKQLRIRAKEDSLLSQVKYEIVNSFWRLTSLSLVQNKSINCLPNSRSGFLEVLEVLDLSGCSNLNTFPEISSNIKELYLSETAIKQVPSSSVELLSKLWCLKMKNCRELESLPNGRSGFLEALEVVDLRGCSNLNTFPEISSNIKELRLSGTAIKQMPSSSVELLSKLWCLKMKNCRELESLPNGRSGFLEALEILNLNGCSNLNTFPEISSNIKELRLSGTAIKQVPSSSVELLSKLERLQMHDCKELESLPSNFFSKLTSLSSLYVSGCSRLKVLPEIVEPRSHEMHLHLSGSAIQKLPSFIGNFDGNYWRIYMNECSKLALFPRRSENCFPEDRVWDAILFLSNCNLRELPEDLCIPSFITNLHLNENDFERIPATFIQLPRLEILNIRNCKRLLSLPKLPSNVSRIMANDCWSLKEIWALKQLPLDSPMTNYYSFDLSNCWKLDEDECLEVVNALLRNYTRNQTRESLANFQMIYPGSRIPEWVKYQNMGDSIQIHLPSHWFSHLFLGFAFYLCRDNGGECCYYCVKYECHFGDNYHFSSDTSDSYCWGNVHKGHMVVFVPPRFCEWVRRHSNFEEDVAFFKFTPKKNVIIKKCGVIPLYAQKDEDEFCGTFEFPNLGVSKLKRSTTGAGSFHCMLEKRLNEINSSSMFQLD